MKISLVIFPFQSWAAVTIEGNDMMNGRIEFLPGSRTTTADEDKGMPGKDAEAKMFSKNLYNNHYLYCLVQKHL